MTSQRTRDRLVERLRERGIRNERVLEVMRQTPRHLFVDEALSSRAYEDTALPIGFRQTISQPYTVARMTEILLAGEQPVRRVLEIGTGSGYQGAILAQLVEKVYSVERIRDLYLRTRDLVHRLGYRNFFMRHTDGTWGWPEQAPFDAIIATAAADEIPQALLEQLADGGRMLIPLAEGQGQRLCLLERKGQIIERQEVEAVSFVPFCQGEVR
ncbi:MAG: protein-L-isoaspartate(D-aspartate) O-methyltransferase [Gammaproteobacteria bacterium]|nr:protein-L-isoaspartate(D-aspartate) O-methyltransferase [Gammaproteobacteria bacterium]MDX5375537.1 protein-L-isoaspartate(D-aspartate) O-methyltransferase [Gammaproteobacteria bacterium]